MKAAFTHNNAYDAILLSNGTITEDVTKEVFADFAKQPDLDNWQGTGDWEEYGDDVKSAASSFGDLVAYYNEKNELVIVNSHRWEERKEFYSGN